MYEPRRAMESKSHGNLQKLKILIKRHIVMRCPCKRVNRLVDMILMLQKNLKSQPRKTKNMHNTTVTHNNYIITM